MAIVDVFADPSDTEEAIMAATYTALCEHGYADLTIQRIGEQFPKSPSLIYHHYGSKDELLLECLSYMLDHFETSVPREEYPDSAAQLRAVIDHVVPTELEPERREFYAAMAELRAQAAHDPAYRDHFTHSDAFFRDRILSIIDSGIEEGVFTAIDDSEAIATMILRCLQGCLYRRVTADVESTVEALRSELNWYIEQRLINDPNE